MKHFNANGMTMSQILGFSKPIIEENDLDRAELLYKKRLARLNQIGGGQELSNGQMPDQVRHDVLLGGEVQVKADLSIPAQVNTSFVPYITSVGKQCLQPMACGIKLIALLFFVSLLFNNAALAQSRQDVGADAGEKHVTIDRNTIPYFVEIKDKSANKNSILYFSPEADLVNYPLYEYKAIADRINSLEIGSQLPDEIWDLPLRIVNDLAGRDSVTLRELAVGEGLLVLDFWATWCKPCLESMNKWKDIQPKFSDQLQVVGLMMDYDYKAELTIEEKGWSMAQLIGPEVYLLNAYFCGTPIIGPSAWIYNGQFIGVTGTRADGEAISKKLLSGEISSIPIEDRWSIHPNL